jgi:hypothetical protein
MCSKRESRATVLPNVPAMLGEEGHSVLPCGLLRTPIPHARYALAHASVLGVFPLAN